MVMEGDWWHHLVDNVVVTGVLSATHAYIGTMKELLQNTFVELTSYVEPVSSSSWLLSSRDVTVLLTAVCSVLGFTFSLLLIYIIIRMILWICFGRNKIETVVLLGRQPTDRSVALARQESGRWFNQAWLDLMSARNDFECDDPAPEWVCFKSHQAVEKALKALLLSRSQCLLPSHDIIELARQTGNIELVNSSTQLHSIIGRPGCTRYPDRVPQPKIPRDIYLLESSLSAHRLAQGIVQHIRCLIRHPVVDDTD